jgi:adenine deaminase
MGAAELQRRLAVARGDEPADLVIRGGRVLCVFTREWLEADVAIVDGVVAGLGSYEGSRRSTPPAAGSSRVHRPAHASRPRSC